MSIFKKLFGSKKWVTALAAIVVDLLVFWQLPAPLAASIATFVTLTTGVYIAGQAIVDATGNHDDTDLVG